MLLNPNGLKLCVIHDWESFRAGARLSAGSFGALGPQSSARLVFQEGFEAGNLLPGVGSRKLEAGSFKLKLRLGARPDTDDNAV